MNNIKIQIQSLLTKFDVYIQAGKKYSLVIFVVFVGLIYSLLLFRINSLSTQQPTELEVSSQVKAAQIPHIDKDVVKQLESLEDNSVNVKALFNQARSNPFQ